MAAAVLLAAGCATPNVNPAHARANTGYVDFHADTPDELYWDVSQLKEGSSNPEPVYSELNPPKGGFLRLAFPPGVHRLRITFLNRVVSAPAEIAVEVQDGKITPVRITLNEAGTTSVRSREFSMAPSVKNNRRAVRYGSDESRQYELSAQAEPPLAYQPKEQVPAGQ